MARRGRRSIRLKGYGYRRPGYYFVTICVQGQLCVLGEVRNDATELSAVGRMVSGWIRRVPERYPAMALDRWVIMPNHLHLLIVIRYSESHATAPTVRLHTTGHDQPRDRVPLWRAIQWLKTMTTNEYIRQVRAGRWPPFDRRFWHRNYWERVVRTPEELARTRRYIANNPTSWQQDHFYSS